MDDVLRHRTRNTIQTLEPGDWWTVDELAVDGGLAIYYRLGRSPRRPADLRDDRGRTVLEAFGGLPLEKMGEAIDTYRKSLLGVEGARWEQARALAAIGPLASFLQTFGPLGVGWGSEFGIRNPEADRLKREADRQRWLALGIDPDTVEHHEAPGLSVDRKSVV